MPLMPSSNSMGTRHIFIYMWRKEQSRQEQGKGAYQRRWQPQHPVRQQWLQMPGWRRGNVAIRQRKWEGNVWTEEKGMGTMLVFTMHHGALLGKDRKLHVWDTIRTQSDSPTRTATHGLLQPHICPRKSCLGKHSYTWGEASPHRRKKVQKDDDPSQANKERKTTNTRPHHFTNKLVCSASCAHFYKVQLRFQRQKCWSYQEHRVTLLWTEGKKRLFSIGLI